jgi:hypothetical protein
MRTFVSGASAVTLIENSPFFDTVNEWDLAVSGSSVPEKGSS